MTEQDQYTAKRKLEIEDCCTTFLGNIHKLIEFDSGATRGTDVQGLRYDLISEIGLRRLAATYGEGAEKHKPRNWEKGLPASDTLNHSIHHIFKFLGGDRSEDHLAHAAWGLFAVMHFEETMPEMIDTPQPNKPPNCEKDKEKGVLMSEEEELAQTQEEVRKCYNHPHADEVENVNPEFPPEHG